MCGSCLLTTLAHAFTACVLYRSIGGRLATYFVLCPAGIMLASFHGNSDPLVVAFLIWAVYCAEQRSAAWAVGLLFAAGLQHKDLAAVSGACILLSFTAWRQRILFVAAAFAGWFAFGAPYTFSFPMLIARKMLGYRSLQGWWGFSIVPGYNRFGVYIAFAAAFLVTIALYRGHSRLYWMVGASIAMFLIFTPGFGLQYLDWILPFCFVLGWRTVLGMYIFSSALLFIAYTHWSGGLPWYFADSLRAVPAPYSLPILYGAFICWIVLIIGVFSATPAIPWKRAVTG